ncbi:MAG: 4-(cytidine 5'-diphospho)-2-C-methyl-D-erythritol kinase [Clostridia bacterium]|nr:4-(cytidine 5'-diphospho)-2-C-methyl-D-erythritol kinase [Clostridia bacterium]
MESVRIKSYAKLNLTLSITGSADGYHTIDSLVTSVDLYDLIVLKKRSDKQITIAMHGCGSEGVPYESNNAVKAAELFMDAYGTCGADITVYKNIPMGAGLGGSSADSAGVLNGLEKLYGTCDLAGKKLLADKTGSDTRYMLSGGYARLTGRGNEVTQIESGLKLNYLLLAPECGVSSAQCYKTYDKTGGENRNPQEALSALLSGDKEALAKNLCNDLAPAAKTLCKEVGVAFDELTAFAPLAVNMTGSGSGVYALFDSAELRAYAKSRYRGKFRTIELKTYIPK